MTIVHYFILLSQLFFIAGLYKSNAEPWKFVMFAGFWLALALAASCL